MTGAMTMQMPANFIHSHHILSRLFSSLKKICGAPFIFWMGKYIKHVKTGQGSAQYPKAQLESLN